MAIASESVAPFASVERMVSVSAPLNSALPWYERLASAALICAWVPESVRVEVPLAPALIVAPPARLTFSAPLVTLSCVVARLPSTSLTEIPAIESDVSSFTLCAPGTVFTGPSFTELTVIATASESVAPLASVESTVSVSRAVEVGVALVAEARQRGVDLRLRARERQGRAAVGARADRRPAGQADVQRAVGDGELRGGEVAVHIVDRDAADRERRVFVDRLCTGHGVHRAVVDRAHGDGHGVRVGRAIGVGREHRQRVGAVEVGVALVAERLASAALICACVPDSVRVEAAVGARADRRPARQADVQRAVGDASAAWWQGCRRRR